MNRSMDPIAAVSNFEPYTAYKPLICNEAGQSSKLSYRVASALVASERLAVCAFDFGSAGRLQAVRNGRWNWKEQLEQEQVESLGTLWMECLWMLSIAFEAVTRSSWRTMDDLEWTASEANSWSSWNWSLWSKVTSEKVFIQIDKGPLCAPSRRNNSGLSAGDF